MRAQRPLRAGRIAGGDRRDDRLVLFEHAPGLAGQRHVQAAQPVQMAALPQAAFRPTAVLSRLRSPHGRQPPSRFGPAAARRRRANQSAIHIR